MSEYKRLKKYLTREMRMSHIYQPTMIMCLLKSGGKADIDNIASELLSHDISQQEYYQARTKDMVGKVLTKNGITKRHENTYNLIGFEQLSREEVENLISLCLEKLTAFLQDRGNRLYAHRVNDKLVPGSKRYQVLKRAKFRCELCGISAEERALHVDHIRPRTKNGDNELSNLQALCQLCNTNKRNTDDTDFRGISQDYEYRAKGCPFCLLTTERVYEETKLSTAIIDAFPVSEGHTLIIPKRHVKSYFDLYQPELNDITRLLIDLKLRLSNEDKSITGFNVGINDGADAGQTVNHCHVHLIPRREGDMPDPRGGIRCVIPDKQKY